MRKKIVLIAETGCRPEWLVNLLNISGSVRSPVLHSVKTTMPHQSDNTISHLLAGLYFSDAIVVVCPPYGDKVRPQRPGERELFTMLATEISGNSLLAAKSFFWTGADEGKLTSSMLWQVVLSGQSGITAIYKDRATLLHALSQKLKEGELV